MAKPKSTASKTSPGKGSSSSALLNLSGVYKKLIQSYQTKTPSRIKLLDAFLLFLFVTGVLQFIYCVLLSDYPFNSFLAGFSATVGQFVFALSLRMQIGTLADGKPRVPEGRAFTEFLLASMVLHFFVVNFLG
ncbi:oligosaccharyltransferase complex subunit epsilon [Malassezia pachydermatis]|uniref:Dolichyl-diphosphooligosaccharide--protein glycosyltransferase subunit OST2 n=1 Tax=Malassezia pachydermatis TaxID=77020 RepID=A0A0N0RS37_9BASI|nr:apoptotic cell death regulator dad1 [Malassezia pachydermatis]KOS13479.1 apoptotic cell death regulator dad1 [Malassezia pachydermatis]